MACGLTSSTWAAYDLPLDERPRADATAPSGPTKGDELLLRQNVAWFCSLRWLVVAAMLALAVLGWAAAGLLASHGVRLQPIWPLSVAALLASLNIAYLALARSASRDSSRCMSMLRNLWVQIVLDLAVLTVVVHCLGSLETCAPFTYLFHIVLACIFFPPARSLLVTLLATGLYVASVLLEITGVLLPRSLFVGPWVPDRSAMPLALVTSYVGSVMFISATVWYLASRLADAMRRRDAELAATNRRLAAATEERTRHLLRTTHQLKAPFAAIHANTQLLLGGYCGVIPARSRTVIEQIAARCELLSREIKAMLQLANLRSSSQAPPRVILIDLSESIRGCLTNLAPQAAKRSIVIQEDLSPAPVCAVKDHAVMMIENLLSNAINYSHDGQQVSISCRARAPGAVVTIRDCGIGIPAEKLPRIFDDYFRTNEAVRHNGASTGLGLAIVRQAAMVGKVGVHVESSPAEGTAVSLYFPASPDTTEMPCYNQ